MSACLKVLVVVGCSLAFAPFADGQCLAREQQTLVPSDRGYQDQFGQSVAIDGNLALVGAHTDDAPLTDSGSVYAFELIGGSWVEVQKLAPSNPGVDDEFGDVVALDGNVAVIGAPGKDARQGAAWIFRRTGGIWIQEQRLLPSQSTAVYGGTAVLCGNVAVVGDVSSAYIFEFNGTEWVEQQVVLGGGLGSGVALGLEDDVLVVWNAKCAQVFRNDGGSWVFEDYLCVLTSANGQGTPIAIEGDLIALGERNYPGGMIAEGAVVLFRYDGTSWSRDQVLTASDADTLDILGKSVALSGNVLVADRAFSRNAVVWEFDGSSWVETRFITGSSAQGNCALSGSTALVGRPGDISGYFSGGSVQVHTVTGLSLRASSRRVEEGDPLSLNTCAGEAGALTMLVVTDVSGIPTGILVGGIGALDANGARLVAGSVPVGAAGLDLTFLAFALDSSGTLVLSPPEWVSIQP